MDNFDRGFWVAHARTQIDQMRRRVVEGEKIPHGEKIFSVFEEHTEWICKGKSGVPQELGVRICVAEDEFGFIIHHTIGWKTTDDKLTIPVIEEIKKLFSNIKGCSFDKAFYSPENKKKLAELLEQPILPKKGKRSRLETEEETAEKFVEARKAHSAVESAIASLQNHGLSRCPDKGKPALERYVSLGVVAFNFHKLGSVIQKKRRKDKKRNDIYRETYFKNRSEKAA